jgi:hypothetical protein
MYICFVPQIIKVTWRILDINSGLEATGIATTNLPANTTLFTAEY